MDVVRGIVVGDVGGAGIAEGADVGLQAAVVAGAEAAELYVVVLGEAVLDAAHTEDAVGVGGGDDGLPLAVVGLVAGAVADEHTLAGGQVASLGHVGGAVHVFGVVARPLHGHLPPDLFLEGLGLHLGARQEELGACGQAEVLAVDAAGDAAQGHGAVAVPAVDVLFLVGEVPSLQYLFVLAEVAEGLVGVDAGEATVEDSHTDALAVDAAVAEELAAHAHQLRLEGAVDGGIVHKAVLVGGGLGERHAALGEGLHTEHIGQRRYA